MAVSKKKLEEQKKKEEEIQMKLAAKLHQTMSELDQKRSQSAAMFQNTKVTSCSKILQKNGQNVCLAFANGAAKPVDLNSKRLPEVTSLSQDQFKVRDNLHAGMLKKPLEPYHPNAFRSRLPQPTVVMPYKNSSQIVIGDRSSYYKR